MNKRDEELLDMLAEECAEVIQAIMKIKRHGIENYHPLKSADVSTNRDDLKEELTQVLAVTVRVEAFIVGHISGDEVDAAWQKKLRWSHHQEAAE